MPLSHTLISHTAVPALALTILYFQYRRRDQWTAEHPIVPTLPSSTQLIDSLHPPTSNLDEDDICPLCRESYTVLTEEINTRILQLPRCGHIYCEHCLTTSIPHNISSCPLCESPFCNLSTPTAFTTSVLRWNITVFCTAIIIVYQAFVMLRFAFDDSLLLNHPWLFATTIALVTLYAVLQGNDFARIHFLRQEERESWWRTLDERFEERPRIERAWVSISMTMALSMILDMQLALWEGMNA